VNVSWKEISEKRNWNRLEMSTLRKPKMNKYQLSKSVPTTNFFEGLEKELDDENNNIKLEKIAKPSPIFLDRINNYTSLSRLLKEVADDEYAIKIMNEQIKIQPKSSVI